MHKVCKRGGTKHSYGGITIPTDVPEVLTTNEDRVLYARTITMLNLKKVFALLH